VREFKVAVCRFPGNFSEHPTSSGWVIATALKMAQDPAIGEIIPLRFSDTPITMTRNLAVKTARERGADYILMIDSDMDPDCESDGRPFWDTAWEFLLRRREAEDEIRSGLDEGEYADGLRGLMPATIAAPYCGAPPHEGVFVMQWKARESHTPEPDFRLDQFDREAAAQRSGIEEVAALPTGLILYDARVFDHIPRPWFDYEWADPPFNTRKASTEDIYQTRNASLCGCPQFVAWDCWAAHNKIKRVRKPRPLTPDIVADSLAEALRAGRPRRGEALRFVRPEMAQLGGECG
jgi:hypothetical protein